MRIAVATWSSRQVGGVETYLSRVIPALLDRGHDVAILHETDAPDDRPPLMSSRSVPQWSATHATRDALENLRTWMPDVVFAQGMDDPVLEARVLETAPSVFFAHAYRGTCISGTKSCGLPMRSACERTFGWPCLMHYLPRRCGGSSPRTMVRLYRQESERRSLLGRYSAIVTFSEHIRREYERHGVAADRTHVLPSHVGSASAARPTSETARDRLLFAGRLETLKGGDVLLDALPLAEAMLGRPLYACFAGDGRARAALEARARGAARIEFTGWVGPDLRDRLFAQADLLVVPSLWPEPFGLIGVEAAVFGVPAAAFDTGGIRQWLTDGVNGHLAPATPPTARSLATAIARCLGDPTHHAQLANGAVQMASRHTLDAHVNALTRVLDAAAGHVPRAAYDEATV